MMMIKKQIKKVGIGLPFCLGLWVATATRITTIFFLVNSASAFSAERRALFLLSPPAAANSCNQHRLHSTSNLIRRFGTATPDSLYRLASSSSSPYKRVESEQFDKNNDNTIHPRRDDARSSFWSTSIQGGRDDGSNFESGQQQHQQQTLLPLPNVPTMDYDGPLPRDAYRTFGNRLYEPKPTCLLSVALDVQPRDANESEEMNPHRMVRRMQRFIDSGLTTFSLRLPDNVIGSSTTTTSPTSTTIRSGYQEWAEENVYGRLLRDTPATALTQTHLIVPMTLPTSQGLKLDQKNEEDWHVPVTADSIRKTVLGSLQRMGADCIDTLQLQYVKSSPYHLEVLDYVRDLQREGWIRSIAGRNLPSELLEEAHRCGFRLDTNQLDGGNLLMPLEEYSNDDDSNSNKNNEPVKFQRHRQQQQQRRRRRRRSSIIDTMSQTGTRLVVASPLASGLLTERYLGKRVEPKPWEFASLSEHYQYSSTTLPRWYRQRLQTMTQQQHRKGSAITNSRWQIYQRQLLEPLQDIAWKHCVSIAAVSLRWVLQQQQQQAQLQLVRPDDPDSFLLASVAVACRLGGYNDADYGDGDERWNRPQQLRQVFQFALDDEDMERLNELSYHQQEEEDEDHASPSWMDMDQSEEDGLHYLPDLSNRRLWL